MLDEVHDAAGVLERLRLFVVLALIGEDDLQPLVQEGHDLEPLKHGLCPELRLFEDGPIRPERDRRAGAPPRGLALDRKAALRLAAVLELHDVMAAVLVDLEHESRRERVDDRHTDAVEATRDLVATAAELSTSVEHS